MANSTWREATNNVLALATLDQIASDEDFDNEGQGSLEKYQAAGKQYVKLVHSMLGVRAYNHFANRRIQVLLDENNTIYEIDTGLDPENIRFGTMRNVSVGSPQENMNQALEYWDYKKFKSYYPIESQITTGAPFAWTLLPIERTDESPVHRIRPIPNPDANYTLEFVAKIHAPQLTAATDLILLPKHYEHVLWIAAQELLEISLGEGKEGRLPSLAQQAANQVFLAAGKLPDARKAPRTMKMGGPIRNRGRWYSSPRSVDDNGTVID